MRKASTLTVTLALKITLNLLNHVILSQWTRMEQKIYQVEYLDWIDCIRFSEGQEISTVTLTRVPKYACATWLYEWAVNYVSEVLVELWSKWAVKAVMEGEEGSKLLTLPLKRLLSGGWLWLRLTGSNLLLERERDTGEIKERVSLVARREVCWRVTEQSEEKSHGKRKIESEKQRGVRKVTQWESSRLQSPLTSEKIYKVQRHHCHQCNCKKEKQCGKSQIKLLKSV